MPPVALGVGALAGGALSGAGSAMGGKKGSDAAEKQLKLQQQQLQFGKDIFSTGMSKAWTPAANYWSALLSGNPAQVQGAVGPISDTISRNAQANIRNLSSTMPLGGEQRLAIANAQSDKYNNLARLYAGVQPTAAQNLGQLAALPMGSGTSIMGQGAPQVGAGFNYALGTNANAAQGMQGAGALLYRGFSKLGNGGGGGKGGGTSNAGGGFFSDPANLYGGNYATG